MPRQNKRLCLLVTLLPWQPVNQIWRLMFLTFPDFLKLKLKVYSFHVASLEIAWTQMWSCTFHWSLIWGENACKEVRRDAKWEAISWRSCRWKVKDQNIRQIKFVDPGRGNATSFYTISQQCLSVWRPQGERKAGRKGWPGVSGGVVTVIRWMVYQ